MKTQARYLRDQGKCGLEPGQHVRLECGPRDPKYWIGDWDDELDEMIGKVFRVAALERQGVLLADANTGEELFHAPWNILEPVANPAAELSPGMETLCRDKAGDVWERDVFRCYVFNEETCSRHPEGYPYKCAGEEWSYCIPLAGHEELEGTDRDPA